MKLGSPPNSLCPLVCLPLSSHLPWQGMRLKGWSWTQGHKGIAGKEYM